MDVGVRHDLLMDLFGQPASPRLGMVGTELVDQRGQTHDPVDAARQLSWRTALSRIEENGMPAHQYVVFGARPRERTPRGMEHPDAKLAVDVLL